MNVVNDGTKSKLMNSESNEKSEIERKTWNRLKNLKSTETFGIKSSKNNWNEIKLKSNEIKLWWIFIMSGTMN